MLIKEGKKNQEKHARNRKYKTLIKSQFKKIEAYLQEKNSDEKELKKMVAETQKILDKAQNKKVIHKNKNARKKKQLYRSLNRLNQEKEVNPSA